MMELSHVEKRRTELLQFVLLVIILVLAVITYLSFRQEQGYLVPALTALCLCACLYVIGKERELKQLQSRLVEELIQKQRQVLDEKAKAASLELRLKELTALYRAISAVNSGMHPERTYDTVLRAALDLVDGDCGSLMLVDEDTDVMRIVASKGLSEAVVAQTRQKIGEGIAGWVAEHGEPLLLNGKADEDDRFRNAPDREEQIQFSISVPLQLRSKVRGVVNLGVTPHPTRSPFTENELKMATIFAQHASVAIENARLMKEVVGSWR